MKFVVVNGVPRSGKSLFVKYCLDELGDFGDENSTVDFVKHLAILSGWDEVKTPKDRKFLSDLKDLLIEWNDVPYKKVVEEKNYFSESLGSESDKGVFFTHCREPKEIQKFVDRENAITVLLRRATEESAEQSNHADANVFDFDYDYTIFNNGTLEDLKNSASVFLYLIQN